MIKSVVRCPNDMVLVFDENDEQLPQFQGPYPEVRERILRQASAETIFGNWSDLSQDVTPVSREDW